MGVPLAGDFDVAVTKPIDSRMVWTGTNLNSIPNKFPGLVSYLTGDQNLYVFQGNNVWEKVVTNNVDSTNITGNFTFVHTYHGQVLYVNTLIDITGSLPPVGLLLSSLPSGYNVTIVQLNSGALVFQSGASVQPTLFRNRNSFNKTAGIYSVASVLRINQREFLLYGDLV